MLLKRADTVILFTLMIMALGVWIIWHVDTVFVADDATNGSPLEDSGLLPRIIGYALVALSVATVLEHIFNGERKVSPEENASKAENRKNRFRAAGVFLAFVCYVVFLKTLGYSLATPIMMAVIFYLLGARLLEAIILGAISTFALSLIFEKALNVQFPVGTIF